MSGMFRDCFQLVGADMIEGVYTFSVSGETIEFNQIEIDKLKIQDPLFTFKDKDIKNLRITTNNLMKEQYPEYLL